MTPDRSVFPTGKRLDPNELAALIDGRLSAAERDDTLARLSASPEDLEIVADAVAIAEELDDDVPDIQPIARPRRAHMPPVAWWLSAAAAILVVATLPVMMRRETGPKVDGYASLLTAQTKLAAGWDAHPWSVTRGPNTGIAERVRAVRVGALTTTIDVSVARKDSATPRIAQQIAALFDDVPDAGALAATYRSIATGGAPASVKQLRDARQEARRYVSPQAFDDGAWLEAARIAANERDAKFFTAAASREQLTALQRETASDEQTQGDVKTVREMVERLDWNWESLANSTANILAQLAAR